MKRIDSAAGLHEKINRVLEKSPRICTNFFLTPEETENALRDGLYMEENDAGLMIFRKRTNHYRTYFYLSNPECAVTGTPDLPAVLEIPYRDRDQTMKTAVQGFSGTGFTPVFSRIRMTRRSTEINAAAGGIFTAAEERTAKLQRIFAECFHPFTGCIPDSAELSDEIAAGHILITAETAGLLHFSVSRTGSELRHLAVLPEYRNQGIGGILIEEYLHLCGDKKSTVWVREDNGPARHLYEKFGYKPDGMQSAVMIREI